jgi:hypothetical protein
MVEGPDPMSDDPRAPIFAFLRPYLKGEGWNDRVLLEGFDHHLDLLGVPRAAAPPPASNGIPEDYWPMLAMIESGNRLYIKAPTSSASGLYQFIRSTWEGEGGKWGSEPGDAFGGLKPTAEEQTARAKTFTRRNADYLRKCEVPINKASLYAAHFFGPATAAKVICANVNERADLIAGSAATMANPSILKGKTVGQFLTWLHNKTGDWAR